MAKRRRPEEIITKPLHVDVLASQRSTVADAIRIVGATEVIDYRSAEKTALLLRDAIPAG